MKPENLTKLTEKIRELVPRLKELSFGCRFLDGRYSPRELVYLSKFTGEKCVAFWEQAGYGEAMSAEVVKIIGHPITLEAVLEALKVFLKNNEGVFVNQYGMFYVEDRELKINGTMKPVVLSYSNLGWHFGQPWENQHEVHLFLFKLFNLEG